MKKNASLLMPCLLAAALVLAGCATRTPAPVVGSDGQPVVLPAPAAKDTYTTTALPVQNRVKELEGQVKAFVDGHRAELVGKSRALNFGVVGYRLSSKLVLPKGRVEDVIAQLKALGRDNLIKRTETLDREALRREPAELLCKLGAYINQTDEFYYDVSEAEAKEL